MNKIAIVSIFAIVLGLGVAVYAATTTTNAAGVVSTRQTLADTSSDTKDLDVMQDLSTYPTKPGQAGKIVRFYSFDVQGSTVGKTVKLLPANPIKANTLVRGGYIKVLTAMTPAGGTITNSLELASTGDIKAAATNSFLTTGVKTIVPGANGVQSAVIDTTAEGYVTMTTTAGGTAITAGKFMVVLDCEMAP